ncbi:hypothetical protein EVAR_100058_1 [Eumeta japonica]|uniref:Uncharacterized protein n=1 Tax=Eumeta variegata TaxID=151549 RepID=A0A4C2A385_EUMVA|nr:hypothetical protein EVAR_100058_1 [Eumeta japonica]
MITNLKRIDEAVQPPSVHETRTLGPNEILVFSLCFIRIIELLDFVKGPMDIPRATFQCGGAAYGERKTKKYKDYKSSNSLPGLLSENFNKFYNNCETFAALKNWSEYQKKAGLVCIRRV